MLVIRTDVLQNIMTDMIFSLYRQNTTKIPKKIYSLHRLGVYSLHTVNIHMENILSKNQYRQTHTETDIFGNMKTQTISKTTSNL